MPNCHICDQHHNTASQVCPHCQAQISGNLARLSVNYLASVEPDLTPRPPKEGHGTPSSRPPASIAWLSWREGSDITAVLLAWADDWATHYQLTGRIPGTVDGLCMWLRNHISRAALTHPAIVDFADEVHTLVRMSRRYAGQSQPTRHKLLCPAIPDGEPECQQPIWIEAGLAPDDLIRCRTCDAKWTHERLLMIVTISKDEAWVDEEVAARWAGCGESTLRRWAKSGKVQREHGKYNLATITRSA